SPNNSAGLNIQAHLAMGARNVCGVGSAVGASVQDMAPCPLVTAATLPDDMSNINLGATVVAGGGGEQDFHQLAPKDNGEHGMESKEQGKSRPRQAQQE